MRDSLKDKRILSPKIRHASRNLLPPPNILELFRLNRHALENDFTFIYTANVLFPNLGIFGHCYKDKEHMMAFSKKDHQFINLRLTIADRNSVEKFASEFKDDAFAVLEELHIRGYKVSSSWIDKQNAYVVSVTGTERSQKNEHATITSWSDDLKECVFLAGYKVLVIAGDKDWTSLDESVSNWG